MTRDLPGARPGVGGGVVVDGRLRFGPDGRAGEIGTRSSSPTGRPAGAEAGAAAAERTVAGYLALGIANRVTVLLPDRVVIGGGIAGAGDVLLDPVREEVRRRAVLVPPERYEIVPAALGPYAGAIGAALWGREHAP